MAPAEIQIPESVQVEHATIHAALHEALQAPGAIGAAARALVEVLQPHFEREEEIALPPLGVVATLAAGQALPAATAYAVLAMTDALRAELPRMLEEHQAIHAAVDKLRAAARAESVVQYQQLADQLALHAKTEEEVLYPTAILVGDIIRARMENE